VQYIEPENVVFVVTCGHHQGRIVRLYGEQDNSIHVTVAAVDKRTNETFLVRKTSLRQSLVPGYKDNYGTLHIHGWQDFCKHRGNGSNLLFDATDSLAQSMALTKGVIMANGMEVVAVRLGYNETPLVEFKGIGWMEAISRFVLALDQCKNWKLVKDLKPGDFLISGEKIVSVRVAERIGWVRVEIQDHNLVTFEMPAILPLALK